MIITNAMFLLSVILCPQIKTFIFGGLLLAFANGGILCGIQWIETLRQDKESAEINLEAANKMLAKSRNPTAKMIEECRKVKLSKRDTEIAVKYFVEHQTPKEIWTWLCQNKEYDTIEWDSVYNLLWRIGRKINK